MFHFKKNNNTKTTEKLPMTGMSGYYFTMSISSLDCTGCGSCANVCPGKKGEKALTMQNFEENVGQQEVFDFGVKMETKPEVLEKFKETTVKGSRLLLHLGQLFSVHALHHQLQGTGSGLVQFPV